MISAGKGGRSEAAPRPLSCAVCSRQPASAPARGAPLLPGDCSSEPPPRPLLLQLRADTPRSHTPSPRMDPRAHCTHGVRSDLQPTAHHHMRYAQRCCKHKQPRLTVHRLVERTQKPRCKHRNSPPPTPTPASFQRAPRGAIPSSKLVRSLQR